MASIRRCTDNSAQQCIEGLSHNILSAEEWGKDMMRSEWSSVIKLFTQSQTRDFPPWEMDVSVCTTFDSSEPPKVRELSHHRRTSQICVR